MTVVVADTSPLNYLILIGEIALLQHLYGEVLVPDVVAVELKDPEAPPLVTEWVSDLPSWVRVCPTSKFSDELPNLDEGERAAILLAEAQKEAVLLLIDDADGRLEAERRHLATTGTVGVLRAAAIRGIVDLAKALARLEATNFHRSPTLIRELLIEDTQRKNKKSQT